MKDELLGYVGQNDFRVLANEKLFYPLSAIFVSLPETPKRHIIPWTLFQLLIESDSK